MNRFIFICHLFHPDTQATSQLFSSLLAELAKRNIYSEVLAGFPAKDEDQKCPKKELWQNVLIIRGGLRLNGKRSLVHRALLFASYGIWIVYRLVLCPSHRAHILVNTNPPFAPLLVGVCTLLRSSMRYSVMLLDVYPDGLVALGRLKENGLIARLWAECNRRSLGRSTQVLVLGRDMQELVRKKYGLEAGRVIYTPHWSPYTPVARKPAEDTKLWQRLKFTRQFVVQYSGNMGLWSDIDTIIEAAALLQDDPNIVFLMIGGGMRRAWALKKASELGLRNVRWLPYQPIEDLHDTLACCHVGLTSQRAGLEGIAVPCKLYGIMASGRPIIAQTPLCSETALVIREEDCGIVVPPGNHQALADVIRSLQRNPDLAERMGERAFAAYQTKYSLQAATNTFERLLNVSR